MARGRHFPLAINYGHLLFAYLQAKYSGKSFLPEDFTEVMLLMYFSFNKAFLFSSQGQFPVLKKVMLFLPVILPPVMRFYDLAGVLPLLFLLFPACLSAVQEQ